MAELRLRAPERPRSIFLGGGTPSLLSVEQLRRWTSLLDDAPSEEDYARMPNVMAGAFDEAGR